MKLNIRAQNMVEVILLIAAVAGFFIFFLLPSNKNGDPGGPMETRVKETLNSTVKGIEHISNEIQFK